MDENRLYPKAYGQWAGNRQGAAPDYARCCEGVWSRERWPRQYQCLRPRGFGPDKAYCKLHDPARVEERKANADKRYAAENNRRRYEWHGRRFFDTLVQIAEGHNDPRSLAKQVIDEFKAGESK